MKRLVAGYCLLATTCLAQGVGDPSFRVIPQVPPFGTRAYLEVGIAPCRVGNSQVAVAGSGIAVELLLNGSCNAAEVAGTFFVIDLGVLAQGQYIVALRVNGGAIRETAFTVSPANGRDGDFPPQVFPEVPRADSVTYVGYSGCEPPPTITRVPGAAIFVDLAEAFVCGVPPLAKAALGLLSPSHYVVFTRRNGIIKGSKRIVVTSGLAKLDYTDLWESPTESGWGMSIVQHERDRVFVVIYAYGADGRPLWLALPGADWESATRFSGSVFRTTGPSAAATFDPAVVRNVLVGTLRIEFDSPQSGTATFSNPFGTPGLPGTKTWRIGRLAF